MKLEVGKYYRTRSDTKVLVIYSRESEELIDPVSRIIAIADGQDEPLTYTVDGYFYADKGESGWDIVEEWKEPKSGVGYVNVYNVSAPFGHVYNSRELADNVSRHSDNRIACVKFKWKEGQFDD